MLRTRIALLVAATTSAVVLAFVVPLGLLLRTQAEDRLVSTARQRAQSVAMVVASGGDRSAIDATLAEVPGAFDTATTVIPPNDTTSTAARDDLVGRARAARVALTRRGSDAIEAVVPVAVPSGIAVIRTTVATAPTDRRVWTAWSIIAVLAAGLVGVGLLVAREAARRIATPLSDLALTAQRLREGDVDARARPRGPVEVVQLGSAINLLADRIDELVRAEREAVADLSHRLRTPVTALQLDAESVVDPALRDRLEGHVGQLRRSIDSIIADARRPLAAALPDTRGRADLVAVVTERGRFWTPLAQDQGRRLDVGLPDGARPVRLTPDDARDLVDNLIDNVFAHTPEGAPVRLTVTSTGAAPDEVVLLVEDGGSGAAAPDHGALERGVSGAGSTGLGLDIVRRLARDAGGQVDIDRSPLGGWRVRVGLQSSPPS